VAILRNAVIISMPFNWTQYAPRQANVFENELNTLVRSSRLHVDRLRKHLAQR
jgi:hypothetical protein